jgi:histidyl-tRNA synthetase
MGIERLLLVLPERSAPAERPDLALVALGEKGFRASVSMAQRLRGRGTRVLAPLCDRPMGAQLKRAERAGARFALFVGESELSSGRFGLKNLESGEQTTVEEGEIPERIGGRRA